MPLIEIPPCRAEIASGIRHSIGKALRAANPEKSFRAAIVTDRNVGALYLDDVRRSLDKAKIDLVVFTVEPGEVSKSFSTLEKLVEFLAAQHFTRSDVLLALGGGVVGDLTGFAAASFLRGVPFYQVPTTLLAMVDSSIGGKTAINLAAGKNLCGTFYQPQKIFTDPETLATLPDAIFADGAAEALKYGMICDRELFAAISGGALQSDAETIITRCIEIKASVVQRDTFDRGERRLLNFGHTLGHAIEIASNFAISHGSAVAIGMMEITRIACRRQLCPAQTAEKLQTALKNLHLPTANPYPVDTMLQTMLNDKKRHGGILEFVVPRDIGKCELLPVPVDDLKDFLTK